MFLCVKYDMNKKGGSKHAWENMIMGSQKEGSGLEIKQFGCFLTEDGDNEEGPSPMLFNAQQVLAE